MAGKSKAPGNVWNGVCFSLCLYWALMHLALWAACCCSFSITNTDSPQRNGLMEFGEVHRAGGQREKALSLKLLADTLIPTFNSVQVMKMNVWQQFFGPYKSCTVIFLELSKLFLAPLMMQYCAIQCIPFHLAQETSWGRKSQTSLIPVALLDFHSLLFNVFVIICIPSNQWVNRSIHNKWHCGC